MSASQLVFSFSGLNSVIMFLISKFTTTRAGNLFKDFLVLICHILTIFRNFDLELTKIYFTKMIRAGRLSRDSSKSISRDCHEWLSRGTSGTGAKIAGLSRPVPCPFLSAISLNSRSLTEIFFEFL